MLGMCELMKVISINIGLKNRHNYKLSFVIGGNKEKNTFLSVEEILGEGK